MIKNTLGLKEEDKMKPSQQTGAEKQTDRHLVDDKIGNEKKLLKKAKDKKVLGRHIISKGASQEKAKA